MWPVLENITIYAWLWQRLMWRSGKNEREHIPGIRLESSFYSSHSLDFKSVKRVVFKLCAIEFNYSTEASQGLKLIWEKGWAGAVWGFTPHFNQFLHFLLKCTHITRYYAWLLLKKNEGCWKKIKTQSSSDTLYFHTFYVKDILTIIWGMFM